VLQRQGARRPAPSEPHSHPSPPQRVAAAALFLACKAEEVPRRAREVIYVLHRAECRRGGQAPSLLDPFGARYDALKAELVRCERHLLRAFGFVAHVEPPHGLLLHFAHLLELAAGVRQAAWGAASDALRTTLPVRVPAEALACGAILWACRAHGAALPEGGAPWWTLFGASTRQVAEVAAVIATLHTLPRPSYIPLGPPPPGATPPRHQPPPPRRSPPPSQPAARRRSRSRSRERGREGGRERRRSRSRDERR